MRAIAAALFLSACAQMPQTPPEPRVITVDVPMIVQRGCPDRRGPVSEYPDTDEKVAAISKGDYELLGRVFRAGRDLRDARLREDDVQIKGCE